jgi:hypothetical protein
MQIGLRMALRQIEKFEQIAVFEDVDESVSSVVRQMRPAHTNFPLAPSKVPPPGRAQPHFTPRRRHFVAWRWR